MEKLTCEQAKRIALVEYLSSLGYEPQKIKGNDHWYLSPLRTEKTASFKVNHKLNVWYDHGLGKGGDIIDFGTAYYGCSVSELLQKISSNGQHLFSFQPHSPDLLPQNPDAIFAGEKEKAEHDKIVIMDSRPLASPSLLQYLSERNISIFIAQTYCKEVDFRLYGREFSAIGFPNDAGGYELRNAAFKGSSSPKAPSLIQRGNADGLITFEGFFNFLSLQTLYEHRRVLLPNCLILNSLSFLDKSRELMERYSNVSLLLDRDVSGKNATGKALTWNTDEAQKYVDGSGLYKGFKDLNEWLIGKDTQQQMKQEPGQSLKRHFRL